MECEVLRSEIQGGGEADLAESLALALAPANS